MSQEIEIKILEVQPEQIAAKLTSCWAACTERRLLQVDWYRLASWWADEDEWYLRIRKYGDGPSEVTWKSKTISTDYARIHKKEINFFESEPEKLSDLFLEIGLVKYAHQDKYRTSWSYQDWRFDLDEYPGMPVYLEIEWKSAEHIRQAVELLGLGSHKTSALGEKSLIADMYALDWYHMHF